MTSHSCANIKLRVVHFIRIGYENWSISSRPVSAVWSELTSLRRNRNCIFNGRKLRWRAKWRRVIPWWLSTVNIGGNNNICSSWDDVLSYLSRDVICRNVIHLKTSRVLSLRILCKSCWHDCEVFGNLIDSSRIQS